MADEEILFDRQLNDDTWADDDDDDDDDEENDNEGLFAEPEAAVPEQQKENLSIPAITGSTSFLTKSNSDDQVQPEIPRQDHNDPAFCCNDDDYKVDKIGRALDEAMAIGHQIPWYDRANAVNSREEAIAQGLLYRENGDTGTFPRRLSNKSLKFAGFLFIIFMTTVVISRIRKSRQRDNVPFTSGSSHLPQASLNWGTKDYSSTEWLESIGIWRGLKLAIHS
ncbi:hypothetical protein BX666DRAFT_1873704 [Dichotomocladium elegans]|nr:hypothetical protein BX666DRAFT_1873704 [Dichotomocladium elegans]